MGLNRFFRSIVAVMVCTLLCLCPMPAMAEQDIEWEYAEDTSPFSFDVWWAADWGFNKPAIEAGWDMDNPIYRDITEKTGATINFIKPSGTDEDLLGPMMAAGDLPDVLVMENWNSTYFHQMKDAGQIHAFSDLIDEHCPNMRQILPESLVKLHTDPADGKIWQYVSMIPDAEAGAGLESIGQPACTQTNICFARKDLLEAFGQTDITDIDTLTDFLAFVKENYPEVDPIRMFEGGDPRVSDTFYRHFGSTFGSHLSGTYPAEDGTLQVFMYDPNYVEYLGWLNSMYTSGIITTNMLAEDRQTQENKTYNAEYAFIVDSMWGAFGTVNEMIKETYGEEMTYIDVGPIKKDGKWECDGYRGMGAFGMTITTNAKMPDRIIKCFEYMITPECQTLMAAGPEGHVYDVIDGGNSVPKPEALSLASTDLQSFTTQYKTAGPWAFIMQDKYWEVYLGQLLVPQGSYSLTQTFNRLQPYIRPIWDEGFINIIGNSIAPGSDMDVKYTNIRNMCTEAAMKMIIADSNEQFAQIYDDCIAQIETAGVEEIHQAFTETYLKNKKMLGL